MLQSLCICGLTRAMVIENLCTYQTKIVTYMGYDLRNEMDGVDHMTNKGNHSQKIFIKSSKC